MKKKIIKLAKNHTWRCKPGHKIFVADRGAVRFDYPETWVVLPGQVSIKFHDRQPPDDNCRLEVSFLRLDPSVDWSGLPLASLLGQVLAQQDTPVAEDRIVGVERADLDLAWAEYRVIDPGERREAAHRMAMARSRPGPIPVPERSPVIQALLTLDFWPEDAGWVDPVWEEALRSLQLGVMIDDPARGGAM